VGVKVESEGVSLRVAQPSIEDKCRTGQAQTARKAGWAGLHGHLHCVHNIQQHIPDPKKGGIDHDMVMQKHPVNRQSDMILRGFLHFDE